MPSGSVHVFRKVDLFYSGLISVGVGAMEGPFSWLLHCMFRWCISILPWGVGITERVVKLNKWIYGKDRVSSLYLKVLNIVENFIRNKLLEL